MHTTYSKSSTYRGVVHTRKAGQAVLAEDRTCNGAVRWIRIRVKALRLAYRCWKVTRQLRAKKQRIIDMHEKMEASASERRLSLIRQRR